MRVICRIIYTLRVNRLDVYGLIPYAIRGQISVQLARSKL